MIKNKKGIEIRISHLQYFNIKQLLIVLVFVSTLVMFSCDSESKEGGLSSKILEENFINPPNESKPKTWMHAMSGNMSKAGLTKDLESMAKVGIGGLLLFNITQGIPNGPLKYNSEEHHEMITHAAKEAQRLGLSFGVHNCDGWSSSGGPWVKAEESMKMIVWSSKIVEGGGKINIQLEEPTKREEFYKDISVIAYPALNSEIEDAYNLPSISSSDIRLDLKIIADGKKDQESRINQTKNGETWIQFQYDTPKTVRSVNMVFNDRNATATLQVSEDGRTFQDVRELFKVRTGKGEWAINDHFPAVQSKYFRLKLNQSMTIKDVELSSNYYIQNILGRTAIARTENQALLPIGSPDPQMIIDQQKVMDVSENMDDNGQLSIELPAGTWTVLRFGYTSTGAFNNPASDEGRGLEVDKLSRPAFKKHYDAFVKRVNDNSKVIAPDALQYAEIDSYEMGGQNWTDDFEESFKNEFGYNIKSFLPLIAGRFMNDASTSEKVLDDFRDHICDRMTKNYFAYFTELCHADGIKSYIEPYGFGPLNDLDVGGYTDIPMGEFWMNRPITQVASAIHSAHIYGKPVISAESFTSGPDINWKSNPRMAKISGDLAWTEGINEFMFHRFAHQANTHVEPGMTMNRWGFHFDRTQTWWENAGQAWFNYIARGSYLLRQGIPVSDLLVFVGDGSPNSALQRNETTPEVPRWINMDCVNRDVLLNRITVKNKELVLPEETTYKFLMLQNSEEMKLTTLRRLVEIAENGVPIVGDLPEELLGYNHSQSEIEEFNDLKTKLEKKLVQEDDWGAIYKMNNWVPDLVSLDNDPINFIHRSIDHMEIYFLYNSDSIGKAYTIDFRVQDKIPELWNPMTGKITISGLFEISENATSTKFYLEAGESTFVVFRKPSNVVNDVKPVLNQNLVQDVKIYLDSNFQFFASILNNGDYDFEMNNTNNKNIQITDIPDDKDLSEGWKVFFDENSGFGGEVSFDKLTDWKDHPIEGIRYYSGTAIYKKSLQLDKEKIDPAFGFVLDLGEVEIAADVKINGKSVAVSWMPPYRLDVTEYLLSGENTIEIEVSNLWSNRLIGEERFPPNDGNYQLGPHRATDLTMPAWYTNNEPRPIGKRKTFTTAPFYKANDELVTSGLLGPVRLTCYKKVNLSNI
jgi:hypothetical protein